MPPENDNQDPNAQMVDPAIGEDELQAFLKTLDEGFEYAPNIDLSTFQPKGSTDDPLDDDNPHPDETDDDDDDSETPPASEASSDDDDFTVNGNKIPRAEIQRLYEFDQFLRANPDKAQRVAETLAAPVGEANVSPAQPTPSETAFQAPEPPAELDLEDPTSKFLWDQTVEARKEAWEARQEVAKTTASITKGQQAIVDRQVQEDMAQALDQFKAQFPNLNDDDIALVRKDAGPLVQNYMATLPPVEALRRSMEVAGYANSDVRPKLLDPANATPTNAQKSAKRKSRLGSLSGTPRSAPKVDSRPKYTNDREMVQGFADALAEQGLGR